jgi:murein DD-endopeptidase MepM/ murein hydrolase activator NlpD
MMLRSALVFGILIFSGFVTQANGLDIAINQTIDQYNAQPGVPFTYEVAGRTIETEIGGIVYLQLKNPQTAEIIPGVVDLMVVTYRDNGWNALLPGEIGYSAAFDQLPPQILRRIDTTPYKPVADRAHMESINDYQFPWQDGAWGTVTRSYRAHGPGQIDFDLTGLDVTAAKDGTIIYANDSNTVNGYDRGAWWYWNAVIIQHTDHEFSLYGHLAQNSIPGEIKTQCTTDYSRPNCAIPVKAGDVIAAEGNTGYSRAPHLHLELGQNFGITPYFDVMDADGDGKRDGYIYAPYLYAEQNVAFKGYTPQQVAAWDYGMLHQASHRDPPPIGESIVRNGDFERGTEEWTASGQVSWAVQEGIMRFLRLNTSAPPAWASFYQDLNYGAPANTAIEITLELGNDSRIDKTISVMLRNSAGRDYGFVECNFAISANTPLTLYTMHAKTTSTWANVRLEIGVNPPDSAPAALVDNIAVSYQQEMIGGSVCEG